MKTKALLIVGTGLAAMAAWPGQSQQTIGSALEAACRATEVTAPDSCPCTIKEARKVGLNDSELASLFKDDGHSQPVDQTKYSRFWQVKSTCLSQAMMASMGISASNPLPGVPEHMRPKMPGTPAPKPPVEIATPPPSPGPVRPAPSPGKGVPTAEGWVAEAAAKADYSQPGKRTLTDINGMISQLAGTAWEYTDDQGEKHRFDFLPEGNLAIYQITNRKYGEDFVEVSRLFSKQTQYGAIIGTRVMHGGGYGDLPLNSLRDSVMNYQKRYVRTGEEWLFKKVGPATESYPAKGPQPLGDGFWSLNHGPANKGNPLFNGRQGLFEMQSGDKLLSSTNLMNKQLFLVGTNPLDCDSSCQLIVNDFDQRANKVRKRVVNIGGVDSVGVRPEGEDAAATGSSRANTASLRAYDGFGGWYEWMCSATGSAITCEAKAGQLPTKSGLVSDGDAFLQRLAPVLAETVYDAGCWDELLLAPSSGMPKTTEAMWAHYRNRGFVSVGTATDQRGVNSADYKIWLDGKPRVLKRVKHHSFPDNTFSDGSVTLSFQPSGEALSDNPAYGFTPVRATLKVNGESHSFNAIQHSGC